MKFTPTTLRWTVYTVLSVLGVALVVSGLIFHELLHRPIAGEPQIIGGMLLMAGMFPCGSTLRCLSEMRKEMASTNPLQKNKWWKSIKFALCFVVIAGFFFLAVGIFNFVVLKEIGNGLLQLILGVGFILTPVQYVLLWTGVRELLQDKRHGNE